MKEYKIIITRYEDVTHEAGMKTQYQNTHKKNDKGEDIWDYLPRPKHVEKVQTEVFSQQVPNINIVEIVAAINGKDFWNDK